MTLNRMMLNIMMNRWQPWRGTCVSYPCALRTSTMPPWFACAGNFERRPPTHSGGCAATDWQSPPPAEPVHRHPQLLPTRADGAMPTQSVCDGLNDGASLCEPCWGDGHRNCQRARQHRPHRCRTWLVGRPNIQVPKSLKWTGGPLAMTSASNGLDATGWRASKAVGRAPSDILDMPARNVVANVGRNRPDGVVREI